MIFIRLFRVLRDKARFARRHHFGHSFRYSPSLLTLLGAGLFAGATSTPVFSYAETTCPNALIVERESKVATRDQLLADLELHTLNCSAAESEHKQRSRLIRKRANTLTDRCERTGQRKVCKRKKRVLAQRKSALRALKILRRSCASTYANLVATIDSLSAQINALTASLSNCVMPIQPEIPGDPANSTPSPAPTNTPQVTIPPPPECSDGIDNDGDGLIDLADDPGCESTGDSSESSEGEPRATELTQWGITFTFDKPYRFGKFVNGDYWVTPDTGSETITIISMSPAPASGLHGWEVNPTRANGIWQGYDVRANFYSPSRMPALPYVAKGGDSILKTISDPAFCTFPVNLQCLSTAAVLTILNEVPSRRGEKLFRPSFHPGTKELYSIDQINWGLLPSLTPPTGITLPSFANLLTGIERVQIDYLAVHEGRHKPKLNSPSYGAEISRRNNDVLQRLLLNDPLESKKTLTIAFIQYGLDLFAALENGMQWPAVGGHGQGRLIPVVFAGTMLESNKIKSFLANPDDDRFGEVSATYYSPSTGMALYGEKTSGCGQGDFPVFQYWDAMRSHAIARTCRDPHQAQGAIDGGERPGWFYQTCCSSGHWIATYTSLNLMPALKAFFYDPPFMDYMHRWVTYGTWTKSDTCAPAVGKCVGGDNNGYPTTSALAQNLCVYVDQNGNVQGQFEADMSQYGITFGPDGNGGCILDTDPSDGIGRFPYQDGVKSEYGLSTFQSKMKQLHLTLE